MNNFIQPGETMTFTAPTGGVVSGHAYLIGALLVVAANTVAETLPFPGAAEGVFTLPKHAGTAWTEGESLYWDDSAKNITTIATANTLVGAAADVAASGDTTGSVRLNGSTAELAAAGSVGTEDLAAGAVTAAKAAVFVSAETTATGSAQNVAHGLGVVPSKVLIVPTLHPGTPDTGAFTITEGTHTTTNVVVTMTLNCKFKVLAWA